MASTNKTTHYELSQYIGTDKPTYLTDYNQDMDKIDTGIYAAKSLSDINNTSIGTLSNLTTTDKTSLVGAVNEVNGKTDGIGTLANLTTTDKTNLVGAVNEVNSNLGTLANLTTTNKSSSVGAINEVNTNLGTLSSLTTTDKTSAVGAINEVKNIIENFNLTTFTTYDSTQMTTSTGTLHSASILTVATNSDGSLAKIYGNVLIQNASLYSTDITIQTSLRPVSEITITGNILSYSASNIYWGSLKIKTNGEVVITAPIDASQQWNKLYLWNSLLFIKDFGDVPTPQV